LDRKSPWLPCRATASPARLRLFCLPHAGGGANEYRAWSASLPASVQVCPILLPGRETRYSEQPYTDFDRLADVLVNELKPRLDIPYAVFGHSMGALLAFECVRGLLRSGSPAPLWLFVSGRRAPDRAPDPHPLHALPDPEFLDQLNRIYKGIPEELLDNPEILEVFLPTLRADVSVVESYRFKENGPLDCPISAFAGETDTSVTWQQLFAWKRHTRRQFAAHIFPGGHFYPREPLLRSIAGTLDKLLA
jgi:medium-chain acyl-[acyl-carrier-protein] hydrolase